jgi:hypothetical protein
VLSQPQRAEGRLRRAVDGVEALKSLPENVRFCVGEAGYFLLFLYAEDHF